MQVKRADDRRGDIEALEQLLARAALPPATARRIEGELRQIRAGQKGEQDAAYEIELYFGRSANWVTIHDLRIEVDGHVAQIDHLIINRLAEIWVCESKHFAEGVSVNEHGEWQRWWQGRPEGIPSPIEQNHRHVFLLQRVFDDGQVRLPRRLGLVAMKPDLRSLVLVSNNARISRPKTPVPGLEEVIKVEQLKPRLSDAFDAAPAWRLGRAIGRDSLASLASDLAALHRPAHRDWMSRFGLEPGEPPAKAGSKVPTQTTPAARTSGHRCAACDAPVSFAVVRFCWNNKARFGGAVYCMDCQPKFA